MMPSCSTTAHGARWKRTLSSRFCRLNLDRMKSRLYGRL
jgi:hypothetical protein